MFNLSAKRLSFPAAASDRNCRVHYDCLLYKLVIYINPPACNEHFLKQTTLETRPSVRVHWVACGTCSVKGKFFQVGGSFDHCNSLLHGLPKYLLARLQAVQNAAARVVTMTPKFDHITLILINLHWLPVEFRITFKVLLLVYKALHGLAPSYISGLLNFKTYSRSLRSSRKEYLAVPRSRLKTYGDRAFSIAGPKLWNNLPLEIRKCASVATFKQSLKTFLFKLAYSL